MFLLIKYHMRLFEKGIAYNHSLMLIYFIFLIPFFYKPC